MKAPIKLSCFAFALIVSINCARADTVTDPSTDFVTLDQLSDYSPDPTYDPTQDPLHGFCYGTSPACYSNGTVTPTPTDPPKFGFTIAPGPQTGTFFVDLLIPNNDLFTVNFNITGTQGGANNNSSISGSPVLVSQTAWTGGTLSSYLGISASPSNPLSAWLPYTQGHGDAGATGYYVYSFNLGLNTLQPNAGWASGPLLNVAPLPTGSLIVGFLDTPGGNVATANSSAIFISGSPSSLPEPRSWVALLLALAILASAKLIKRPA